MSTKINLTSVILPTTESSTEPFAKMVGSTDTKDSSFEECLSSEIEGSEEENSKEKHSLSGPAKKKEKCSLGKEDHGHKQAKDLEEIAQCETSVICVSAQVPVVPPLVEVKKTFLMGGNESTETETETGPNLKLSIEINITPDSKEIEISKENKAISIEKTISIQKEEGSHVPQIEISLQKFKYIQLKEASEAHHQLEKGSSKVENPKKDIKVGEEAAFSLPITVKNVGVVVKEDKIPERLEDLGTLNALDLADMTQHLIRQQIKQAIFEKGLNSDIISNLPIQHQDNISAASIKTPKLDVVHVASQTEAVEAIKKIVESRPLDLPRRIEVCLEAPEGAKIKIHFQQVQNEVRAQLSANDHSTLEWLKNQLNQFKSMEVGQKVNWLPPQMESEQNPHQEQSKQDHHRRHNSHEEDETIEADENSFLGLFNNPATGKRR